jgi:hypothetical protein
MLAQRAPERVAPRMICAESEQDYTTDTRLEIVEPTMKMDGVKAHVRDCSWLIGVLACVFACSPSARAQRVDPAKAQMQEMDRREMQLNNLGEKGTPNDPKRARALMDQVSEDFQRILTLHNEIVRAITDNKSLSEKFISDATGEIKKRSIRLQTSLGLAKPETKQGTGTDLKLLGTNDKLVLLCKRIENFVRNPIIEKPGTVDARQLQKAGEDLQGVVDLSDAIKKNVDKQKP